jgi:hypothetical protein
LHSTKWNNEKKKGEKPILLKKIFLVQDAEGNEENRYLVPDPNKTKINNIKGPINAHKNTLKEEILQEITENFMEKIVDRV